MKANLDVTQRFLDYFFPSYSLIMRDNPDIPYANNVIFKNLLIYGFPGSGKTTLANSLAGEAIDRYGKKKVNARISESGDMFSLLNGSLLPVPINILFCDNTTLVKQDKDVLMRYFRLRNIFSEEWNMRNGYILSILSLHRFHAIPIELRSCIDGLIIRDISLNPYDKIVLESFIDDKELYSFIKECSDVRIIKNKLMNYSIFIGRTMKGIVEIPPNKRYFFKAPYSLIEILELERGEIDV